MPQKNNKQPPAILNRRARFDYELGEELIVGIVLTGPEVRAARDNHVQLKGSFVNIRNGELWLNNASFSLAVHVHNQPNSRTVDTSVRKLLANRKQIDHFQRASQEGMSIVPTKLLTRSKYIKLVIALGKGKKRYDKRQTIKRRDQEREVRRQLSGR